MFPKWEILDRRVILISNESTSYIMRKVFSLKNCLKKHGGLSAILHMYVVNLCYMLPLVMSSASSSSHFHFVRCQGQSPQEKMLSMFKSPILYKMHAHYSSEEKEKSFIWRKRRCFVIQILLLVKRKGYECLKVRIAISG